MSLALLTGLVSPWASAEGRTLRIRNARQLRDLSDECILDSYSKDLTVYLEADIDLEGQAFYPIPSFSGVFDGKGHSISNFVLATDGSHQGLFRYLQEGGEIRSLTVEGRVEPENSQSQVGGMVGTSRGHIADCRFSGTVSGKNYVGGVAGENYGTIERCTVSGEINGKRFTGGVAGYSEGLVADCTSDASVNTSIEIGALEFDSLTLNTLTGASLVGAEDTDVVSDSGGVVGYSIGIISNCVNKGAVGYAHYGYNVGGIAGRHAGYIVSCVNHGQILGRQDVGGIVGQMEPFLLLLSRRTLTQEVELLQAMIDQTLAEADNISADMETALYGMALDAQDAAAAFDYSGAGGGTGGGTSGGGTTGGGTTGTGTALRIRDIPAVHMGRARLRPVEVHMSAVDPSGTIGGIIGNNQNNAGLQDSLTTMGKDMGRFTDALGNMSQSLSGNLSGVAAQFAVVMLMMTNALNGSTLQNMYTDVSEKEPAENIEGVVTLCVNHGSVEGDKNVGGVAGDMGIEYQFDLENQLMSIVTTDDIVSTKYESKCIQRNNVNRGSVLAKKDNVGGIAGQTQMGIIDSCEGYGDVSSSEGGFVGGVVGNSRTSVTASCAMCELSGLEYVGGIAGFGTKILDCASLVGVGDVTACCGAIAGWADMTDGESVLGNVFVAEHLGAVDGISYAGFAEPVTYAQLQELEDMPEDFGALKLSFVADGTLVAELPFDYGGSISLDTLPQVPAKEGYSGSWEPYDYGSLHYGDTVYAIYTSSRKALAADRFRDGSPQSVVLVEGEFSDRSRLLLQEYAGEVPAPEGAEVLECWKLEIEDPSGEQSYLIHYLTPERSQRRSELAVYALTDGVWTELGTGVNGSYTVFDWTEDSIVFCAAERERALPLPLIALGVSALAVAALLYLWSRRRKAKRAQAAASIEEASAEEAPVEEASVEGAPTEDPPGDPGDS